MSLSDIPAGNNIPDDFNVIIEVAAKSQPTKYELDKELGILVVDRFMPTAMHYPANYGYIPSTLAEDGDPADVLVLTPCPVQPGSLVRCRPLGMLQMTDENGEDSKILAVPVEKVCLEYAYMHSLQDLSPVILEQISHFFTHYKDLEPDKWVKIRDWVGSDEACQEILACVKRYQT